MRARSTTPAKYYGLIINNGTLTQLDATVNASFRVDGVTIFATQPGLRLHQYQQHLHVHAYRQRRRRSARRHWQVEVTFGANGSPGLVIINGTLTSLDMTISANIGIAGVNLAQANLQFTYTASTDEFTLTGTAVAGVDLAGVDASIMVDLGRQDLGRGTQLRGWWSRTAT